MTAPKTVPDSHLFYAAACIAADVGRYNFMACLPGGPDRHKGLTKAQKQTLYLLVAACGISRSSAAQRYKIDPSSVTRIIDEIANDRSDFPLLDQSLSAAERMCMSQFNVRV